MERLNTYSSNALVYVLVHKMDKIRSEQKKSVFYRVRIITYRNWTFTEIRQKLSQREKRFVFLVLPFGMKHYILYFDILIGLYDL